MSMRFVNQKRFALHRLKEAAGRDEVDKDIINLLNYINSLPSYYTTSSCSGRITLLHDAGSKPESSWLGKWHREVTPGEVIHSLSMIPGEGVVWFKCESPILHIASKTLEDARCLLITAREAGYKRVGLQGLKKERYVVEICDTLRVDCPVAADGRLLVDEKYLRYLTGFSNIRFRRGRRKLNRFESGLREEIGYVKTPESNK